MSSLRSDFLVITSGAYIALASMLLTLPFVWVVSFLTAILIHELFHWIAVRMCGGTVYRCLIDVGGIRMDIAPMTPGRELICALAGPLGSAVLVCLARYMPLVGLCAFVQGIFNLLPVYPLDGGRALRNLLAMFTRADRAERISLRINMILIMFLLSAGIWCMVRCSMGILPVLFPVILWWRTMEKSPRQFWTRRSSVK